ncbi:Holliday junction DNA helicase RuvB [Helicobacter sp. 13S00401-1]|uniref:Holliday junction branch migration DNA helicase RuvB n=1 Tax=Helicobacter sp. 13S00401-1 TaxID=1905758 RepID=UPI000BA7A7E3|nr:Holliday junction branch migration DNA helicase RuvB [Helicobacter sp. 13S00401-1]PAF51083.1 Holliday junction DNA helicase RuvB [Helicobacter sp. 13S00401-1]
MEKLSIIDRNELIESTKLESEQESTLRPSLWDDFIGQEQIKKNLQISISAAKKRHQKGQKEGSKKTECLDHILFFGPPGLGKTTLSYIVANEMNANIKVSAAPMIEKSGDLAAIMTNLQEGDILFIDEIHRLSPAIEEILYPAMEDYRLDIIIGSGPAAQTIKIDLAPFTLIGATTRAGMLSNPLRDRFGMNFRMQFYNQDELSLIIQKASLKLNKNIDSKAASEIAKRSRGTPRIALRLLRRIRDYADVAEKDHIDYELSRHALDELGVNELGFDELDLKYLTLLANAQNRPIGLSAIAAFMSEDEGTIEDVIEPYLLANGFLERTAKGRIATFKTYEVCKIPSLNNRLL